MVAPRAEGRVLPGGLTQTKVGEALDLSPDLRQPETTPLGTAQGMDVPRNQLFESLNLSVIRFGNPDFYGRTFARSAADGELASQQQSPLPHSQDSKRTVG